MEHATQRDNITARRTYLLLKQTFLTQLSHTPFEQITLTDLCSSSLISRSTFYRYFEDKYDLLRYCLQALLEDLGLSDEVIYFKSMESFREFLIILIRYISDNKELYQRIYATNKNGDLVSIIREGLIQILREKVRAAQMDGFQFQIAPSIFTSLMADFYFDIVECYLEQADQHPAETFIESVCLFAERSFFLSQERGNG